MGVETRGARWRRKRKEAGFCTCCGRNSPAVGCLRCQACIDNKKKRYAENPETARKYNREHRYEVRAEVLGHYGNKCACCGETTREFLSIDHVNNDGAQHRKEIGVNGNIYWWLKKNNYPEGFQCLCHNCNLAKGFYGVCPHQR